jgi:hypothetical protein
MANLIVKRKTIVIHSIPITAPDEATAIAQAQQNASVSIGTQQVTVSRHPATTSVTAVEHWNVEAAPAAPAPASASATPAPATPAA